MSDPTPRDCSSCPSFLQPDKVFHRFGKSVGAAMCGRFGYVLSKPGAGMEQNRAIRQRAAKECDAYGDTSLPFKPEARDHLVMLPIPELRDASLIDSIKHSACSSCGMCKNLVPEAVVASEIGFSAGLCAAKGKLIMTNRQQQEATGCEYKQFGTSMSTTTTMSFLPEFGDMFGVSVADPVKSYFDNKNSGGPTFIEPSEYVSDKEVTEEDRTAGIRAWRKVLDPDGSGNEVFLPIYDASFFDDDQRAAIPKTGEDEHPELYLDHFGGVYALAVAWMELDETPALWGQAGVGKTELLRHMAWLMQLPFVRVSITKSTELDDLAGKMQFSPEKGTWFHYGRLSVAWTKPCVLCLDEPNTGPPDVWQFIRPMTDNSKQLVLDMNEGEKLDRCLDCFPALAMNPAWDIRNIGAMEIADADSNRLYHTFIDLPPESLEKEIIQARVRLDGWELTDEQMRFLMGTAKDIRGLAEEERLPITWAIRQQIKVARALRWFSPQMAYRRAIGDALDREQQKVLMDQVNAHWTEGTGLGF